ncbi:MAG TPA: hypothetical protein VGL66_07545 [Caulobacteraceae bacterium]
MDESESAGATVFFFLIGLPLIALIPAAIARSKGRNFFVWWLYGVFLWIIAFVHSILIGPARRCPHCDEGIRPEARVCPHCQRDV